MPLDLEFVRKNFPGLNEDFVFFDNAGGSQILKQVTDRIQDYLLHSNVQLGASYEYSQKAGVRVQEATNTMADLVNAKDASEIVMGPSTSLMLRILAMSYGQTLKAGDEVIVTNCDHEANIGAWLLLEPHGIKIKYWKANPDSFELELDDLGRLMTPKTRMVALTHTSNILGHVNPIKEIAAFVHKNGAQICIDGVAYAPHKPIDVQELDVDFYAFSLYKVYGPHYAVLYGKKELLLEIPGFNHYFIEESDVPYKFQPGNVNYELCYGSLGICDYLEELAGFHDEKMLGEDRKTKHGFAYDLIATQEKELNARMLGYLNSNNKIRIIGRKDAEDPDRVPTFSFMVGDEDSDKIVLKADPHNIGIRFGDFYATRLIQDLGLAPQQGVVRVSMTHYNTLEEVDRLIEVFQQII